MEPNLKPFVRQCYCPFYFLRSIFQEIVYYDVDLYNIGFVRVISM